MNRIRDLREDRELKQRHVAELLGMSQQNYSKIESGATDITSEKLILLADFYQVSVDYLLGLSKNPRRD